MENTGIYIHIPFCRQKCFYCDFNSYAGRAESHAVYFDALNREIILSAKKYGINADTVYLGGGTPTSVDEKLLINTVETVFSEFNIDENAEITAECNPKTIGYDGLKALLSSGINRLSIGLQSTDDRTLKALGRIHSLKDFEECFNNARWAGFENLSLDLMYGLPDQSLTDWEKTLKTAASFGAEHISCYLLKVEEGTPFSKMSLSLPDDDLAADMYEKAIEILGNYGYSRYEISNFAKCGKESRHNLKYWHCDDFLGLGAGAYSCMNGERFSNLCGIDDYIEEIFLKGEAKDYAEMLNKNDMMSEFVFLGLRCREGISAAEFGKRFNENIFDVFGAPLNKYISSGFIIFENDRLYFSDKAFFVSNTILSDFV